jgi:hypothetical protein
VIGHVQGSIEAERVAIGSREIEPAAEMDRARNEATMM